jgi:triphosphoribosyl-dephospho-CoA synthase
MTPLATGTIAGAYRDACLAELLALKPGNVHVFSGGQDMTVADFEASADASAGPLTRGGATVGQRILGAIEATHARVNWNTNLGIVLLCAPIAAAAERPGPLASSLSHVLGRLDVADAVDAFAAIRLAAPGGLGNAEQHDVAQAPMVDLRAAMAAAAGRDRIARAYVNDFEDIFSVGRSALRKARDRGLSEIWCATAVHMTFLADEPDTHIARKFGARTAETVRRRAEQLMREVELGPNAAAALIALDVALKQQGLNPGTCADFTVATLFLDTLLRASGIKS